jgi:hypothetical protein
MGRIYSRAALFSTLPDLEVELKSVISQPFLPELLIDKHFLIHKLLCSAFLVYP